MKNILRIALVAFFGTLIAGNAQAKSKEKQVYAFTFGTCFNDSVVYLSAISPVPDGVIESKTKFLNNRSAYSNQFKFFLDSKNGHPHTCAVFFSTKKEKLQKKYAKIRQKCNKNKKKQLAELPATDFVFLPANN